ncbi:MAG: hypothetical protein KA765_10890, partial [Thermoflexales bacterium]|nr:hypothetical protein [Thermoflexales bacterium]
MSTPWKRVVVVGALLLVSLCAAYVTSRTLWLRDYEELETQAALRDVARVRDTVQNELEQLAAAASAYANWDDTYRFVVDLDPEYVTNNLNGAALGNLHVALVGVLNS